MKSLIGILNSNETKDVKLTCNRNVSQGDLYNLFDGVLEPYSLGETGVCAIYNQTLPYIINIQFKTSKPIIQQYTITSRDRNQYIYYPKSWTFEASNDGETTWTTLDTQTNIAFTQKEKKIFNITNSTSYSYYRLKVTATSDSVQLTIGEMELFGNKTKFLLKDGNEVLNNTGLTGNYPPTEKDFLEKGTDDISIFCKKDISERIEMKEMKTIGDKKVYSATVKKTDWNWIDIIEG